MKGKWDVATWRWFSVLVLVVHFLDQPSRSNCSRCLELCVILCADLGDLHLLLLAHSGCHSSSDERHDQLWQLSAKYLTTPVKSDLSG